MTDQGEKKGIWSMLRRASSRRHSSKPPVRTEQLQWRLHLLGTRPVLLAQRNRLRSTKLELCLATSRMEL